MLEEFLLKFPADSRQYVEGGMATSIVIDRQLRDFFLKFSGTSFGNGLYRVIHPAELIQWQERILLAYPEFTERITCFGFDWMGNAFALDSKRLEKDEAGIVLFEIGTAEALELPSNLHSFHEVGLLEYGESALAISFYDEWLNSGGTAPQFDQCVGYKKPLFLGGIDEVTNMEISDIEVYWHVVGQFAQKTRGLKPSVRIKVSD